MSATKFDAILFDKDGTIFDSERLACDAWLATTKAFDVHFTVEMYKAFIGVPTPECHKIAHHQFGESFPMEGFIVEYRKYMSIRKQQGVPLKKGFSRFFAHIKAKNIPVGVVTSSSYNATIESFQHTNFMPDLDVLVTLDDITHPKPAPDCYLLACKTLSVSPERVLVFEDSSVGITASLTAGCQTVAIPDLAEIKPNLLAKCHYTFSSFDEAYAVL